MIKIVKISWIFLVLISGEKYLKLLLPHSSSVAQANCGVGFLSPFTSTIIAQRTLFVLFGLCFIPYEPQPPQTVTVWFSSISNTSELTEAKQADKLGVEPFELLKFGEEKHK